MWAQVIFAACTAGILTAETTWNTVRLEIWLVAIGIALLVPAGWHFA